MPTLINRRNALTAIGGTIATVALPWALFAQQPLANLQITDLGGGLWQIAGAGANVVVANGSAGVLLIDGGSPERSAELLRLIAERFQGRRIQILFNTNWRAEHTGSNETLGAAGTTIMAHENTKLWLVAGAGMGGHNVVWSLRRLASCHPLFTTPATTEFCVPKLETQGVQGVCCTWQETAPDVRLCAVCLLEIRSHA